MDAAVAAAVSLVRGPARGQVIAAMSTDRKTPRQRRAVIVTAVSLALVAVAIYIGFIMVMAAR